MVLIFGAETKGSLCSPGYDLCGLNDGSVSSTGQRKEHTSTEHGTQNGCLDCFTFTVVISDGFDFDFNIILDSNFLTKMQGLKSNENKIISIRIKVLYHTLNLLIIYWKREKIFLHYLEENNSVYFLFLKLKCGCL